MYKTLKKNYNICSFLLEFKYHEKINCELFNGKF